MSGGFCYGRKDKPTSPPAGSDEPGQGQRDGNSGRSGFDENQIVLDTDMGLLTVKGKGLHVSRLTLEKGEVDIEGMVDSLTYSSNDSYRKQGESLFARLFK